MDITTASQPVRPKEAAFLRQSSRTPSLRLDVMCSVKSVHKNIPVSDRPHTTTAIREVLTPQRRRFHALSQKHGRIAAKDQDQNAGISTGPTSSRNQINKTVSNTARPSPPSPELAPVPHAVALPWDLHEAVRPARHRLQARHKHPQPLPQQPPSHCHPARDA